MAEVGSMTDDDDRYEAIMTIGLPIALDKLLRHLARYRGSGAIVAVSYDPVQDEWTPDLDIKLPSLDPPDDEIDAKIEAARMRTTGERGIVQ
jgi:hypothetical protein